MPTNDRSRRRMSDYTSYEYKRVKKRMNIMREAQIVYPFYCSDHWCIHRLFSPQRKKENTEWGDSEQRALHVINVWREKNKSILASSLSIYPRSRNEPYLQFAWWPRTWIKNGHIAAHFLLRVVLSFLLSVALSLSARSHI